LKTFDEYILKLSKLNQGVTKYGKAPHKPILLISIFELIDKSEIIENKIFITPELITAYRDNWDLLVDTNNVPDFTLPFYHLSGEKFWNSFLKDGAEQKNHIKSFKQFNNLVDFGKFSDDLFQILINSNNRKLLINLLLDKYFPLTKHKYFEKKDSKLLAEIDDLILNKKPSNILKDEEIEYVRNSQFKKVIPRIYNFTCAFTGMRLESFDGYNFIDACHIIPFSECHDDSISNGIALNPTLHRIFDKGLLSVDENYKILVSNNFAENSDSNFNIKQLHGKPMILPFGENFYPNKENLKWHRHRWNFS